MPVLTFSLSPVPRPERDIGRLQGTGATAMLRASCAQRAACRQVHQNVITAAIQTADGSIPARPARDRVQLGRTGSRSRWTADERHHPKDNRYVYYYIIQYTWLKLKQLIKI